VATTNGSNGTAAKQPPKLRDRISALRYVPKFIALIWETNWPLALLTLVFRISRTATPLATTPMVSLFSNNAVHLSACDVQTSSAEKGSGPYEAT
jgi:hypothetical protein